MKDWVFRVVVISRCSVITLRLNFGVKVEFFSVSEILTL